MAEGMNFNGQKLKEIRQLFQMGQSDVAQLLGVDFMKVIDFELSRSTPDFEQTQILCEQFHVKPMYFYSDSWLSGGIDPANISIRR